MSDLVLGRRASWALHVMLHPKGGIVNSVGALRWFRGACELSGVVVCGAHLAGGIKDYLHDLLHSGPGLRLEQPPSILIITILWERHNKKRKSPRRGLIKLFHYLMDE